MIFSLNLLNNFCWKHCLLNKFFPEWRNMVRRTTSGKKIFVISAFSFIVTFSLICALFALRTCAHRGSVAESWPQATRRLRGHRPHGAIMRSPQPGIRQGRFPASLIAPQVRSAYSHCTRRSSSHAPPPPYSPVVPLPHTARGTAPPRDGAPGAACESAAAHACARRVNERPCLALVNKSIFGLARLLALAAGLAHWRTHRSCVHSFSTPLWYCFTRSHRYGGPA